MNKYEKLSLMVFIMGCFSWHEGISVIGAAMLIIGGTVFLNTDNRRPTKRVTDYSGAGAQAQPDNTQSELDRPARGG